MKNMDALMTFVSIVIIAFGILQIILFFKVWCMTDNVELIWKKMDDKNILTDACVSFVKGDLEETERLVNEAFLHEVSKLFTSSNLEPGWVEKASYNTEYEKVNIEYEKIVEKYTNIYEKINKPLPDFEKYKDENIYLI